MSKIHLEKDNSLATTWRHIVKISERYQNFVWKLFCLENVCLRCLKDIFRKKTIKKHREEYIVYISPVQSWPDGDILMICCYDILRDILIDKLDYIYKIFQFWPWIVLLIQRICNISKRHFQNLALAKQKEI